MIPGMRHDCGRGDGAKIQKGPVVIFIGFTLVSTRPIFGHGKHLFPDIDLAMFGLAIGDGARYGR